MTLMHLVHRVNEHFGFLSSLTGFACDRMLLAGSSSPSRILPLPTAVPSASLCVAQLSDGSSVCPLARPKRGRREMWSGRAGICVLCVAKTGSWQKASEGLETLQPPGSPL
jgi:hypothetical protein